MQALVIGGVDLCVLKWPRGCGLVLAASFFLFYMESSVSMPALGTSLCAFLIIQALLGWLCLPEETDRQCC